MEENPDAIYDLLDEVGSEFDIEEDDGWNQLDDWEEPDTCEVLEDNFEEPTDTVQPENDSWDSEDNVPLSFFQKLSWKRGLLQSKPDFTNGDNPASTDTVLTPWQYFKKYLNDDFFQMSADFTARYYHQQTGKPLNLTSEDIKKFFGMHTIMGVIKFPRIHMYWQSKYLLPLVSSAMPRDKFYLLRVNFHIVDNLAVTQEQKERNKLWKVQPMIDLVRNRCRQLQRSKKIFSIDEQMIPFLGRCPVRQFVKNKPRPVGLKNFVVATSTGTVLDFEIYQGSTTNLPNRELGLGPSVILRLVETIPKESFVYFDRYFTTIPLMNRLTEMNIYGTGTIMSNRVKGCEFKKDKEMKRGESDEFIRTDQKISVTKWKDSRSVILCSTAYGSQPESTVERWDSNTKQRIEVSCPKVVKSYNQNMGGVDICDQMLEYYRTFFRTKKWPFKVILHLFDMAIVNSWQEYKTDHSSSQCKSKLLGLLDFRLQLGEYLLSGTKKREKEDESDDEVENQDERNPNKKRRTAAALPCEDKQFDGFEHWPVNDDLKHPLSCRFHGCDSRSRIRCMKCNVYLCLSKSKNCFVLFHKK